MVRWKNSKPFPSGADYPTLWVAILVERIVERGVPGACFLFEANFAVMGPEKSVYSGNLIGPKSIFCCTLIACNFDFYAAHCHPLLQQAADAVRASVYASYDTVRSQKAQCAAAPDNPETRDTYHCSLEQEVALAIWGRGLRARK